MDSVHSVLNVQNESPKTRRTTLAVALRLCGLTVSALAFAVALASAVAAGRSLGEVPKAVAPAERGTAIQSIPPAAAPSPAGQEEKTDGKSAQQTSAEGEALTPRMQAALEYVARRYRVSAKALQPIFEAAQTTARERRLDPLLIVAIIGIESGFNPFSESTMGALGLMQIMPRYHQDKLPPGAEKSLFLNPQVNIQVGTRALEESIRRQGELMGGLQQFAGALNDEALTYANKVLAEKNRLEQAAQRSGGINT